MKFKRIGAVLLFFALLFSRSAIPVGATVSTETGLSILRVSGRIDQSIAANSIVTIDNWISMDVDETIAFNCTYTPKSASVDFGYVDSDSVFHYWNCTNGSISKTMNINNRGEYKIAIRNNASYAVTVTGTVRY